jgi:hypothetical protein
VPQLLYSLDLFLHTAKLSAVFGSSDENKKKIGAPEKYEKSFLSALEIYELSFQKSTEGKRGERNIV